ncbi:gluconokinase, GntK/IdnK-type [Maricaulaceae bacterium NA33B04]|jgi:gluconokinase|nr:gluconokinase, GntK/IdnK-type [Maricaulaceae bacterium NA33B04]
MGVSGSGKSTLAAALAEHQDVRWLDADDFHPPENVAKMSAGHPLDNEDRRGWIAAILDAVNARSEPVILLACSALNEGVRDLLNTGCQRSIAWCWLQIDEALAQSRVHARSDHFMPASLVQSQFDALQPPTNAWQIDASQPLATTLNELSARLDAHVAG